MRSHRNATASRHLQGSRESLVFCLNHNMVPEGLIAMHSHAKAGVTTFHYTTGGENTTHIISFPNSFLCLVTLRFSSCPESASIICTSNRWQMMLRMLNPKEGTQILIEKRLIMENSTVLFCQISNISRLENQPTKRKWMHIYNKRSNQGLSPGEIQSKRETWWKIHKFI